jgi:uroporphyrinogen decarboxylase
MGATPSSGISSMAYNKLKAHLGINPGPTRIYDVVQQLAQPDEAILDYLGIDVIDIGRTWNADPDYWKPVTLADGSSALEPACFDIRMHGDGQRTAHAGDGTEIARMPAGGAFFDQTCFPYLHDYPSDFSGLGEAMGNVLWAGLPHSPWDHAREDCFWDQLREQAIRLRASTDRALMIVCGCNLFEWGTFLRRIDNFLMDILCQPARVEALLDALMEIHLNTLDKVCKAVGDVVDVCRFGDDLGMDNGPFMNPAHYRAIFKPRHTALCDFVHRNSEMHTFLHSCGSIYQIMPDLIEAGYEVINPVQTNCVDMEPVRLKREFGKDITFWGGGCDTRRILNGATPAEVKRHVLERLDIFAPGGGFVFNTVHNILPEVPPENIMAMFDALREFEGG